MSSNKTEETAEKFLELAKAELGYLPVDLQTLCDLVGDHNQLLLDALLETNPARHTVLVSALVGETSDAVNQTAFVWITELFDEVKRLLGEPTYD